MSEEARPIALTEAGALEGLWSDGTASFRGVRYAAAPAGRNRFKLPQPLTPWTGVRSAHEHGPVPPQPHSRLERVMGPFIRPQDEDCLTLTISTPAVDGGARPVVVFLHGGAYLSGAGSLDWYDGATLSREGDTVIVGVNYRLGALGFLCHPAISPGNLGVADMQAALDYVQRNIRAFGGDSASVTVVGQSAGAHAIMMMLATGAGRGLFHRAILQSTPAALPPLSTRSAMEQGARFLQLLEIDPAGEDAPARIAAVPAPKLVETQMQFARSIARFGEATPPFLPVSDEFSDADRFRAAAAHNAGAFGVDMIVGTTGEEGHAFFAPDPGTPPPEAAAVSALFERYAGGGAAIESYRLHRPGSTAWDLVSDLKTDHDFAFPSLALCVAATRAGARVWAYQFDWKPAGSIFQACHCLELSFVFGSWEAWNEAPMLAGGDAGQMHALGATLRKAWLAFARHGSPTFDNLDWPTYDADRRVTLRFADHIELAGDLAGTGWKPGTGAS